MPIRLPIPKLAASPVTPLKTQPRFKNELFQSGQTWAQDVNYLRDTYMEIWTIWEATQPFTHETDDAGVKTVSEERYDPAQDEDLYKKTEPLLRELILGMSDVAKQLSSRTDVYRATEHSRYDFDTASSYAKAGDWAMAALYQSYALMKLHATLDNLTRYANKRGSRKVAYGYDTSGEVHEGGGTSGDGRHLWDTGNSPQRNHTKSNPMNMMIDAEAESDFPELREFKHKRIFWPPRTR